MFKFTLIRSLKVRLKPDITSTRRDGTGQDKNRNLGGEPLSDDFIKEEAQELNQKITKASELLSEYLRVATEELCLDYGSNDDDRTISTATITSHSTCDSNNSNRSMGSLTRNVRKPVRQRSRDNLMTGR